MQFRVSRFTVVFAMVAVVAVLVGGAIVAGVGGNVNDEAEADSARDTAQRTSAARNPLVTADGGVSNVTLYYQGVNPLRPDADLTALGRPGIVVATGTGNESEQIAAIHSTGAKAYRYVQYYWAPEGRPYEGIDFSQIPGWEFCRTGSTPLVGRTTGGGTERWFYIDANEKAVRDEIRKALEAIKAKGWDGVMFDRGAAATQAVIDSRGRRNWHRKSSCTASPHREGARFSDAYIDMTGLAHAAGLEAMMNNGRSPFDPVVAMRPNPRDKDCRALTWSRCEFISDAWDNLDLVLNETAARPRAVWWDRTFVGNKRSERHRKHGRRTVALVTTASLGGEQSQTRQNVFYQWSRIKLFDIPVAVNTGDDGCTNAGDDAICNRHGLYPELVNTTFGRPLTKGPSAERCFKGSKVRCVWTRKYAEGANVVNVTPRSRAKFRLELGTSGCRYVYDVYAQRPLGRNTCVTKVRLNLDPWTGRPLRYSTNPW